MTKYILNIIFNDNSHISLAFDTYKYAEEACDEIFHNDTVGVLYYDINEVEV